MLLFTVKRDRTMVFQLVLTLTVILFQTVEFVDGVQCYNCMSTLHRGCGEEFELTKDNTSYIADRCDVCYRYYFSENDVYVRNCTPKTSTGFSYKFGCDDKKFEKGTVEICACSKDLCNGARSEMAAILVILFVCLSVYSLYHLVAFDLHLS